ncbi:MAG: hypothetical protein FWD22_02310 [Treponema sp.]|nr:hypothetical protein [Treponema sp.]
MDIFLPRFKRAALLTLIFALLPLNSVFGNAFQWSITGNILGFPADNGVDSDPFPIIPSGGGVLSFRILGPLRVELTEDIYMKNYEFNTQLGYPMASNPENGRTLIIGFITGIQLTGNFPLGDSGTALRIYAGPAADLRIITTAISDYPGDEAEAKIHTDAIREYFWSKNRWFIPVAGIGMDFPINEKFLLGFDLRTWFPVYKLNADDNTSAIDGWRFGAGIRITPRRTGD